MQQKFASAFGHFADNGREYVVTTPCTPRPWGNVISYGSFAVIHGIGDSTCRQQIEDIESQLTLFLAAPDPVEVRRLTLTKWSDEARELDEHRECHKLFVETGADVARRTGTARKCLWGFPGDKGRHTSGLAPNRVMAVSEPLRSFDGDKKTFIVMQNEQILDGLERLGLEKNG